MSSSEGSLAGYRVGNPLAAPQSTSDQKAVHMCRSAAALAGSQEATVPSMWRDTPEEKYVEMVRQLAH